MITINLKNPYEKKIEPLLNKKITYNDMCDIMEEKQHDIAYSKSRQIKEWRRFFELEYKKDTVTIKRILEDDELLLSKSKAQFTKYIEDLIILYLGSIDNKSPTLTFSELANIFSMVNKDYYSKKYDKQKYIDTITTKKSVYEDEYEMDNRRYYDVNLFFTITDKIIKEIITNAFGSLKNRSLIMVQETFKFYHVIYLKEENRYITKAFNATKEQREFFLDLRKKVMLKHNIQSLQEIIYLDKQSRENYFNDLHSRMKRSKELNYADKYANAFEIEYGKEAVAYEYKKIKETNEHLINYNMQHKLLNSKETSNINKNLLNIFINDLISK